MTHREAIDYTFALHRELSQLIGKWDLYNLWSDGRHPEEFDVEAWEILDRLRAPKSLLQVVDAVKEVLVDFPPGTSEQTDQKYTELGELIFAWWPSQPIEVDSRQL